MEEAPTILESRVVAAGDLTPVPKRLSAVPPPVPSIPDTGDTVTVAARRRFSAVPPPMPSIPDTGDTVTVAAVAPRPRIEAVDAVILREERMRARGWAWITAGVSFVGVITLPIHADNPMMILLGVSVMTLLLGVSLWVVHRTREAEGYTVRVYRIFGWTAASCSIPIQYVLGVFSPVPVVVTLGISFFGLAMDRRHALLISGFAIFGYFVCAVLVTLGILPDIGLFPASSVPLSVQIFCTVTLPLFFGVALWMARLSRHSMIEAIRRSNEAMHLAMRREAQFYEARLHLERALQLSGAGRPGRYSGLMVGEYELGEVIGRGAMAEVYRGKHLDTGATAAVKLMHASIGSDPRAVARFEREGALAGRSAMPHVVEVYEAGRTESGTPFIAMELLEGADLATQLREHGRFSPEEGLMMARQVAKGLDALHRAGILHRDVKPQNLFCGTGADGAAPRWTILDFGVCRFENSDGTLTERGVVGTPGYLSPEQARGEVTTPRSDVFSFAAVVYRALTGQPPFSGANFPEVIFAVAFRQPIPPSMVNLDLPFEVDAVLARGLHKEPGQRYANALDFVHDLERAIA